jgi:hypothetical protein
MTETTSYYKKVASITVTDGGSGYTTAPTVSIGGNATAIANIVDGVVTDITVTFAGFNYLSPPDITFTGGGGSGATATANMVYIDNAYNGFKQSLSHLIANQLPDFVRSEFPQFVLFLRKYYEFLDEENQVNNFLLNYEKNFDINRTLESFIPKFRNQYAQFFPVDSLLDERRLIKFIKQFYEAKGSEKALELLFRILYNETIEVFYPSEQILRASDGIWIEDVTLKLAIDDSISANPFDLRGRTVSIKYYENVGSVQFQREIQTNVTNVTKFAYVFPPVYELTTNLPKKISILVPGAGAIANALITPSGSVGAIVGELYSSFDAATDINLTDNTITIASHGYETGDVVVYNKNGGTQVTGLNDYGIYYVIKINSNTIKLAISEATVLQGVAIDLTALGSGTHRLYDPMTDAGNGYFAAPTIQITSDSGSGAAGRVVLGDSGRISHVVITSGGSGYTIAPAVSFLVDSIRTTVEIDGENYGYIVRQLSSATVIDCNGTPPCGFTVGDIFSIDETGSVGPYTIDFEDDSLDYFLNKFNESDNAISPYTLVGRDNRASIRISAVDSDGCPVTVNIFDTGYDFEREAFTADIKSSAGCTATISFTTGAVNVKTGRFKDSRGMVSNVNRLQDNFYYQIYSYVIRSNVQSSRWLDVVKNTTHPAGTQLFGEFIIDQVVDFSEFITTPIQPLHIYQFALEELSADTFLFEVDFIKVLSDTIVVSESNANHLFKVLTDSTFVDDLVNLQFDVGIYDTEEDTATSSDVVDRVIQFVREVNETTITAENAITDFQKVLTDQLYLQSPYALDYFDTNYVSSDVANFSFTKVVSDIIGASENNTLSVGKGITDLVDSTDSITRTVEYYREFAESVITSEHISAGIDRPDSDLASASEAAANHFYKYITDSVSSVDTAGVIPYLVKTDNAGATELLIVANDTETIETIAATEQSLINILKGLFETVTVTEDGIVNTQDYVDGDFGSDYVGRVTYFN